MWESNPPKTCQPRLPLDLKSRRTTRHKPPPLGIIFYHKNRCESTKETSASAKSLCHTPLTTNLKNRSQRPEVRSLRHPGTALNCQGIARLAGTPWYRFPHPTSHFPLLILRVPFPGSGAHCDTLFFQGFDDIINIFGAQLQYEIRLGRFVVENSQMRDVSAIFPDDL